MRHVNKETRFGIILLIALLFAIIFGQAKASESEAVGELLSPVGEAIPALPDIQVSSEEVSPLTAKQKTLHYIVEIFGDDADDFITMINQCENSTFEQHRVNHNSNGTWDKGVAQINSIHLSGREFPVCKSAHNDYQSNIDCAKAIYDKYTWSAWSCSWVIDVEPFWEK